MNTTKYTLWNKTHKAGVIDHDTFEDWIAEFCQNLTVEQIGYAFLYNVSLETFTWPKFESVWEANYGQGSKVEGIYVFVPVKLGSREGRQSRRIGSWLDAKPIFNFAEESRKHGEQSDKIRAVCEKTHFALVDIYKHELADLQGEYAFGIYLSQDATFSVLTDIEILARELHKNPHEREAYFTQEAKRSFEHLTGHVELILGAGIREPYSMLVGKHFKYRLIIPISSYRESGQTENRKECVIKEHIKFLARLWEHRLYPIECAECTPLGTSLTNSEGGNKFMRMDRFMAWSRSTVSSSGVIRARSLSPEALPFLESMNQSLNFSHKLEPKVLSWLYQLGSLPLSRYQVLPELPSSRYYREIKANELLRESFLKPLDKFVCSMLRREILEKNDYPVFLIVGDTGSGKTQLAKDATALWKYRLETPELRMEAEAGFGKRGTEVKLKGKCESNTIQCNLTPKIEYIQKEKEAFVSQISELDLGFLILDEIQSAEPFEDFIFKMYGLADCYAANIGNLIIIYLTSDSKAEIFRKISGLHDDYKPGDFVRRLRHVIEVPETEVEDIVPVIADYFHHLGGEGVRISKWGIAYLILQDLLLPSIKTVLGYLSKYATKEKKKVYEFVDMFDKHETIKFEAFKMRYPKLWSMLQETDSDHRYLTIVK